MNIIEKEIVIYEDRAAYSTFPCLQMGDGLIGCAFRRADKTPEITHRHPSSEVWVTASLDGRNWLPAWCAMSEHNRGLQEPGLGYSASRHEWVLAWHHYQFDGEGNLHGGDGLYIAFSDNLVDWSRQGRMGHECCGIAANPIELENGEHFMYPVHQTNMGLYVLRGVPGSYTSRRIAPLTLGGIRFQEPSIVEAWSGKLIALLRSEDLELGRRPYERHLYQCLSDDWGMTWTLPEMTPMHGHPAKMVNLPEGVLATYGYRREPFGIRACLTYNGGKTWNIEREFIIRDDLPGYDIGYPSTVRLGSGELLTAYYSGGMPNDAKPVRRILGTIWRM